MKIFNSLSPKISNGWRVHPNQKKSMTPKTEHNYFTLWPFHLAMDNPPFLLMAKKHGLAHEILHLFGDFPAMADYQRDFCLGRRLVTWVALKKLCWVWQLRFRSVPFGSLRFLPLKADRDQWTTKEMLLEDTFLTEMTCVLAKLRQMVFLASQISSWKPCQRLQNSLSESSELDNNSEGFRSIKVSASPLQVVK